MTRVLALDTSTWIGGVALVEAGPDAEPRTVIELTVDARDSHADHVLRRIDWLLAEAGWDKSSLDVYAATRGPGSFTGIRVGLHGESRVFYDRTHGSVGSMESAQVVMGPTFVYHDMECDDFPDRLVSGLIFMIPEG